MDLIVSTHMVAQNERQDQLAAEIEKSRVECVSRAYLNGLATFPIVFGATFLSQKTILRLAAPASVIFGSSVAMAGVGTYMLVDMKLKECQKTAKQNAATQARAVIHV